MSHVYPGSLHPNEAEHVPPCPPTPPIDDSVSSQHPIHPPPTLSYLATQPCPADPASTHNLRNEYTTTSLMFALVLLPGLVKGKKRTICTRCKRVFDDQQP